MAVAFVLPVALTAGILGLGIHEIVDHVKREQENIPTLLYFHNTNLTLGDMKVINNMVIQTQDNNKVLLRKEDSTAEFEKMKARYTRSVGAFVNGVGHGRLFMSISRNGDEPAFEHGKWLVVNKTEADDQTISAFEELYKGFELVGESNAFSMLTILNNFVDAEDQNPIKDN